MIPPISNWTTWPIWNGELSLVGGLSTNPEGGYTAVRMGDMGSMA